MGYVSARRGGANTTVNFNTTTKVLSGTVSGTGLLSGLTVTAYKRIGVTRTAVGAPASTDGSGNWSIDLSAVSGITDVSCNFDADVTYLATSFNSTAFVVAFATAVFSGDDGLKRTGTTTTGINGTADTTASLTRTGTVVSGISIINAGFNYEPGEWQIVTTGTGGGTGMRGMIQANALGILDPATFTVSGSDPYGGTLSGGTAYSSNPSSTTITRYTTMGVGCFYFQQGASVAGDYLMQIGSNLLNLQLSTGFYPRVDLNNSNATTGARMVANGQAIGAGVMRRILFRFNTKVAANAGGLQVYLDDTDISNYAAVNSYVYNQTAAGTLNGRLDLRNSTTNVGLWANAAGTGNFSKGSGKLAYLATGYSAIDAIAGTAVPPNIGVQAIRDRFTPDGINLNDGSGGTGRRPNICLPGQNFATGANLGFCGDFTVAGTFV